MGPAKYGQDGISTNFAVDQGPVMRLCCFKEDKETETLCIFLVLFCHLFMYLR